MYENKLYTKMAKKVLHYSIHAGPNFLVIKHFIAVIETGGSIFPSYMIFDARHIHSMQKGALGRCRLGLLQIILYGETTISFQ